MRCIALIFTVCIALRFLLIQKKKILSNDFSTHIYTKYINTSHKLGFTFKLVYSTCQVNIILQQQRNTHREWDVKKTQHITSALRYFQFVSIISASSNVMSSVLITFKIMIHSVANISQNPLEGSSQNRLLVLMAQLCNPFVQDTLLRNSHISPRRTESLGSICEQQIAGLL